jgi:hypothetical protein
MGATVAVLPTVDDLRTYVRRTLCAADNLDPAQTPFFEAVVTKKGRPCGLFFQIQGPRRVRTYALWAGDEARLFFYDSTGQRVAETRLGDAPDPQALAA